MSQAVQIGLAGANDIQDPSNSGARSGQHAIPRFLRKLYEIVNDPANEALIGWSDAGDSFCIYNQERVAHELLGKWFKHQNISSFVRQLNLYGFRKITALQQGLLRMESDTETIQFAHPHFHRGRPDLLALIQRKRNIPTHTHAEGNAVSLLQSSPLSSDSNNQSQVVDVRSVIEGINAIRRQQQAIAADLTALKQSNDALWKEAIEARERHSKHEDTINRILKFLAGVFGGITQRRGVDQLRGDKRVHPRRLLIKDKRSSYGDAGDHLESDIDVHSDAGSLVSERSATVDTLAASVPPALTSNEKAGTKPQRSLLDVQPKQSTPDPIIQYGLNPLPTTPTSVLAPPLPSSQNSPNADTTWNTTLQQLLSSPMQFQNMLQTFTNSQPPSIPPDPDSLPANAAQQQQQQLTFPLPNPLLPAQVPPVGAVDPTNTLAIGPSLPSSTTEQEAALLRDAGRIQKAYHDVTEIDADVNDLQSSIHALIRDMGIDPNNMSFPAITDATAANPSPGPATGVGLAEGGVEQDFSIEDWLNQLGNVDVPDHETAEDFSEFLNHPAFDQPAPGPDVSDVPSPVLAAELSPSGLKRKMEMVELDAPSNKKKR